MEVGPAWDLSLTTLIYKTYVMYSDWEFAHSSLKTTDLKCNVKLIVKFIILPETFVHY